MSTSNLSMWINPQNNTISSGFNSLTSSPRTVLMQGDDVFIDIHMIDVGSGQPVEIPFPPNSTIKLAIGRLDRFPTSGSFTFQYESESVQIPIASTIEVVNSLINGLSSIASAGGVVVYFVNSTTFRIVFNTFGVKSDCVVITQGLYPSSTATVTRITTGSLTLNEVQHVKLKTTPVAYSEQFSLAGTPTISIQELTTSIFRVYISDILKYGNFTISNGVNTTAAINWNSSSSEILSALTVAGISSSSGTVGSTQYSVTKNDTLSWDISRISGSYETLTVNAIGFIGFSTMTGSLNMNTIEVENLINGAENATAIIEVELTSGILRQTLYQGEVTISNDLIDNATYGPIQFPNSGGIPEAPSDSILYGRKNGSWSPVVLDGNNIPDYDNGVVYTVGNQVYYQGKLYRMINSVGGAGYDPVGYPSYWESLSGSNPDLSGYVEKAGAVMSLGATINFLNNFSELSIGAGGVGVYSNINPESVLLFENRLEVSNGTNTTKVVPNGIIFPDLTTQSTAATSPDLANYLTKSGNLSGITDASQARSNLGVYSTSQVDTSLAGKSDVGHNHNFFQLQKVDGGGEPHTDYNGSFLRIFNGGAGGGNNFVTINESNSWDFPSLGETMPTAYIYGAFSKDDGFGNISSGTVTIAVSFSKYIYRLNTGYVAFGTTAGQNMHSWVQSTESYSNGIEYYGDTLTVFANDSLDVYNWTYQDTPEGISAIASVSYDSGSIPPSWSEITFNSNSVSYEFTKNKSNNYDEPVVKRGLLPSLIQELVREKAFSFQLDSSGVTKYGLLWDASNGKFGLDKNADLSLYAKLAGDTFTGKVNITANSIFAPLNLGVQAANPSSTVAGDLWVATNLQFRSFDGVLKTVANTNTQQTFSQPQAIVTVTSATLPALRISNQSTTAYSLVVEDQNNPDSDATIVDANGNVGIGVSNNPATPWTSDAKLAIKGATSSTIPLLRLTQTGIGACLLVEDETTPDATPFVIGPDGRVGIGGSVSATATNKLAVYNGNIILTSGFGIIFGTGSTQIVPYIPSAVAITGGTIDNIIIDGGTF